MRFKGFIVAAAAAAIALLSAGQADAGHYTTSHTATGNAGTATSEWGADSSMSDDGDFRVLATAFDDSPGVSETRATSASSSATASISGFMPVGRYRATAVFTDLTGNATATIAGNSAAHVRVQAYCTCVATQYRTWTAVSGTPMGASIEDDEILAAHDFEVTEAGTVVLSAEVVAGATTGLGTWGLIGPQAGVYAESAFVELTGRVKLIDVFRV